MRKFMKEYSVFGKSGKENRRDLRKTAACAGLCLALCASLAACGTRAAQNEPAVKETQAKDETETTAPREEQLQTEAKDLSSDTSAESQNLIGMPNPFVDCADMDTAAALSGFSFTVPESIAGYERTLIQSIDGDLFQIFYENADGKELLLRKGTGSDDISGDYNKYETVRTDEIAGKEVTLRGNGETVSGAVWTDGDYSYSVYAEDGIAESAMTEIVSSMK